MPCGPWSVEGGETVTATRATNQSAIAESLEYFTVETSFHYLFSAGIGFGARK